MTPQHDTCLAKPAEFWKSCKKVASSSPVPVRVKPVRSRCAAETNRHPAKAAKDGRLPLP